MTRNRNTYQPYIDGQFVAGDLSGFPVENPFTQEVVATAVNLSTTQFEAAIQSARRSFDTGAWSLLDRTDRVRAVRGIADFLEDRYDELAELLTAECGATQSMLRSAQLRTPIDHIRAACDLYLSLPVEEHTPRPLDDVVGSGRVAASLMVHEPIGVVSAIAAYNFPIWTATWKIVPALLAGNSVVLRPSPLTPLSATMFGAAAEAVGLPPGVLNVTTESGIAGAELLTSHPMVDAVSFTGSTAVGQSIMSQASSTVKRVILELGGKSVQLYLDDAIDRAATGCMSVFAAHSGQACVAPTRMLVPESRKASVLAEIADAVSAIPVGDPGDPGTIVGPVISEAQRARCESYVAAAVEAGATVVIGGGRPIHLSNGYFFEPTVLDVPDNSNPAAQDEIFGPVLCVIGYRDLDHAVEIANDSIFGLSAQVIGQDLPAALDVARRIRSGAVMVNGGYGGAYASSGGYQMSGIGRERGVEGIRSFQQTKHLAVAGF